MYKLTLCLEYLIKRPLAYFAMVGVAVCVFMLLICFSILTGFVNKIEIAAKGLSGDVVISSTSLSGLGDYDELIAKIEKDVPEVQAASPFILTFGILQLPGQDFRKTIQVAGIRLPGRDKVSDFSKGLFIQPDSPDANFNPPEAQILRTLTAEYDRTRAIYERVRNPEPGQQMTADRRALADRLETAMSLQNEGAGNFLHAAETAKEVQQLQVRINEAYDAGKDDEAARLESQKASLERRMILPPDRHAILGLGIPGLSFRTPDGEVVRMIGPGQQVALSVIPMGRSISYTEITPVTRTFTVIDDCTTDVSSIDSDIVYVPFETLQAINNMGPERAADAPNLIVSPARCSQIHIKVRPDMSRGEAVRKLALRIDAVWQEFLATHPRAARAPVTVETWRQRQSQLINMIENQRTLMVIILTVISAVAIVLIFVILYVIVVQKTRDIGVLKTVGASNAGVAGIFLAYGGAIGLIGSVVGTVGGCFFVWNINPIADWVAKTTGFSPWNPETFMFEKIPSEVQFGTVAWILAGAVLAGVFGSLLPSVLAARRQPVEALRYE